MSQQDTVTLPLKRERTADFPNNLTESARNNILPSRYAMKDRDGNVIEDAEDIFRRVAKNIALAEAVYADATITVTPDQIKPNHSRRGELAAKVFGYDTRAVSSIDDIPDALDEAQEFLIDDEVVLNEDNVRYFAYDTVVPELPDTVNRTVQERREQFEDLLTRLAFMPNSPTIMNAGDELQQLSACFVNSPKDDNVDIHETINEASQIFKTGGGVGYDWSKLRPYGDPVGSTGGIASGPLTFMQTADQMCETIAQGGVRRGAQMATMHVTHPDIVEFIHSKRKDVSLARTLKLNDPDDFTHTSFGDALQEAQDLIDDDGRVPRHLRNAVEGNLSNFNISVTVTDEFIEAKDNGESLTMMNPRTGEPHVATTHTKEMYERYGLGDQVEVGEVLEVDATAIWNAIVKGAHENGEPGIIHISEANRQHAFPVDPDVTPADDEYYDKHTITATNPCGEQPLMEYDACNLGHINLSTVATEDAPKWSDVRDEYTVSEFVDQAIDWDELHDRTTVAVRFLDNVATMSDFPIDEINETVAETRKVGLGIMGLAELFIQIGVRYGSEDSVTIAREIMQRINHKSAEVSSDLADERGVFDWWDDSKYADPTAYPEWFKRHVGEDPEEWEDGYPMRNYKTTTIAPTGTTSMLANTTGGCEPMYDVAFFKNVSDDVQGDEMLVEFQDYFLRTIEANGLDVETVKEEAVELMQNDEWEGVESLESVPNEIGELFVTTQDLSALEHASIQCALQDGVDAAISKTVNAPNDATLADAKAAFDYVLRNGGKGVTYYRDGTRSKQVKQTDATIEAAEGESSEEALVDQINAVFDSFEEFVSNDVIQNNFDIRQHSDDPQELVKSVEDNDFITPRDRPDALYGVTQRIDTGYGKLYVNINEDEQGRPFELFANIGNSGGFTASFTESLAKIISAALRSGVDPYEIADDLQGIRSPKIAWDKGDRIHSIPDAIGTAMQRYLDGDIDKRFPQQRNLTELQDTKNQNNGVATQTNEDDDSQKLVNAGENPQCPNCGAMSLQYSEGCKECQECGWSEC